MAQQAGFNTRESVEAWLKDKPHGLSSAIAARAALRILPLIFRALVGDESRPAVEAKRAVLFTIRSAFLAWAATRHAKEIERAPIALTAALAVRLTTESNIGNSTTYAAASASASVAGDPSVDKKVETIAFINATTASLAAAAASHGANAASEVGGHDVFWKAIAADIRWSDDNQDDDLIRQPLWLIDVITGTEFKANFPLWVRTPFDAFAKSPLGRNTRWSVWLRWYRGILPNGPSVEPHSVFGAKADIGIATQGNEFWDRDPDVVMSDVANISAGGAVVIATSSQTRGSSESPTSVPRALLDEVSVPSEKSSEPAPSETTPPTEEEPRQLTETVGIHSDEATTVDQLRRRPFAKAIVERLDDVYALNGVDGFAIHIHAPWGAGKSSVLQMMRQYLETAGRQNKDVTVPRWVVVNFDAWKNERRNPPWWPLVQEIRASCLEYTKVFNEAGSIRIKWDWFWWKIRTDFLPYVVGVLVGAVSFVVLSYTGMQSGSGNLLEPVLKIITAAAAVMAAFIGASRVAMFGSSTNAKFYEDISQDPLQRVRSLFEKIVDATHAPICIFIEDLDRCRPDYVIGLLQGIQTIFRHKSVAYVVAADRAWVRASFENQYKDIRSEVGTPSQPLGYLFLEKVFQMSIPLPAVDAKTRAEYWNALLGGPAGKLSIDAARSVLPVSEVDVDAERSDIRSKNENLTREAAEEILKRNDTPVVREALALELSSSQAVTTEATHLLAEFKDCVPEIPRVMKRMINAYAIRYAMGFMAGTNVPVKTLARWTIIEQSAPALADVLTAHPDWVEESAQIPEGGPFLHDLRSKRFRAIVGEGDDRLTAGHIRTITRGDEIADANAAPSSINEPLGRADA